MKLYLSRTKHLNCVLSDEEGRALYQIHTPGVLRKKTTTLLRISSDAALRYQEKLAKGQDVGEDWDLQTEEFARIHWHFFNDTRLIFNGTIHEIKEFMPLKRALSG